MPILVAVPPVFVTLTVPVVPAPITATIVVPLFDVIEVTAVPPIFTLAAVAPVKFVPVIVMLDPTHPLEAINKFVIVGGGGGVYVNEISSTAPNPLGFTPSHWKVNIRFVVVPAKVFDNVTLCEVKVDTATLGYGPKTNAPGAAVLPTGFVVLV